MAVNGASHGPAANGGGIYLNSGSGTNASLILIEFRSRIYNNAARLNGGGVYEYTGSIINVSEAAVIGNIAGGNGGGIYINDLKTLRLPA